MKAKFYKNDGDYVISRVKEIETTDGEYIMHVANELFGTHMTEETHRVISTRNEISIGNIEGDFEEFWIDLDF